MDRKGNSSNRNGNSSGGTGDSDHSDLEASVVRETESSRVVEPKKSISYLTPIFFRYYLPKLSALNYIPLYFTSTNYEAQ